MEIFWPDEITLPALLPMNLCIEPTITRIMDFMISVLNPKIRNKQTNKKTPKNKKKNPNQQMKSRLYFSISICILLWKYILVKVSVYN